MTKVTVRVCKMTKDVDPGYEFRISFSKKSSSAKTDFFCHGASVNEMIAMIHRNEDAIQALGILASPRNGERVKKSSNRPTTQECKELSRKDIYRVKQSLASFAPKKLAQAS